MISDRQTLRRAFVWVLAAHRRLIAVKVRKTEPARKPIPSGHMDVRPPGPTQDEIRPIVTRIAAAYRVPPHLIFAPTRQAEAVAARRAAICAVADAFEDASTTQIGKLFGLDHTYVAAAIGTSTKTTTSQTLRRAANA